MRVLLLLILILLIQGSVNAGWFIIEESTDKFGQIVKDEAYTSLYRNSDTTISDFQLFEAQLDKATYKTGDIAKLTIGSAAKNITVTVEVEKDKEISVISV
jgi:uncharacterized protein YfaS (alpha-2-macroglobulin family)